MQQVIEAISDTTRRKIIDLLKKGEMSAGELGKHFDISGPSMAKQLSKHKEANLELAKRRGKSIHYSINTSVFDDAAQFVITFFHNKKEHAQKEESK